MSDALAMLLSRRVRHGERDPFRDWDDLVFHISVFDHWLTEAEAAGRASIFYKLAVKQGNVPAYLDGERRWLSFYRDLAADGVLVIDRRRQRATRLPSGSGSLSRLVRDSVRERSRMDVIFRRWPVRVLGGFDRTDTFLPATEIEAERIAELAVQHGLHRLPSGVSA